ncbi:MAG: hypothetical protein AMJ65_09150 [Phycisphaerae bacterium SG8_4]|nr:MAG: hypothetical protein AMJ65_09150 [Phycisphaerae bacterium SG8_4]
MSDGSSISRTPRGISWEPCRPTPAPRNAVCTPAQELSSSEFGGDPLYTSGDLRRCARQHQYHTLPACLWAGETPRVRPLESVVPQSSPSG